MKTERREIPESFVELALLHSAQRALKNEEPQARKFFCSGSEALVPHCA
jgi:hypothetical protein